VPANDHVLGFAWWKFLLGGVTLWVASVVVTSVTGNLNMVPTVIVLGSFVVPVSAVAWYVDHYQSEDITSGNVIRAFVVGGVVGILAASLLESWLLGTTPLVYLGVGVIEELAKLIGLLLVSRRLPTHGVRDGIVLGAAVGFGFAALESSGYAFQSMIHLTPQGIVLSLNSLVSTELLRGVLSPFGHGLWTGIIGGVLFGAGRNGHLRLTRRVLVAYLGVSILHALWDAMGGIAALVTTLISGAGSMASTDNGTPAPTTDQLVSFLGVEAAGLALISVIGVVWLRRLWGRGGLSGPPFPTI